MPQNRLKGITIELSGDTTKLQSSLRSVTSEIRNTQSQLRDVEKLLKLDPGNTELLAQKQKLLGQAVEETKRKLDALKQANEQVSKTAGNYDAWKAKYEPIQKEITETQEHLKKLKEQAADADKQLAEGKISQEKYDALQSELKETSDHLKELKQQAKDVDEEFGHPVSPEQYDALQREIVETTAELKKLEDQARQSGTAVQDIAAKGEKLKDLGGKVESVGKAMLPVTGAVVGLGTAAVKTASDFDSSMSKVAAVSGATGEDLDSLREKAREMGEKTQFSASEAADAMNYMAMAGWKTKDMLDGIDGIMNLAAASGEDLATTSDIVTDALTAFGMSADESGHFADILAAASSNANTNVSMLGESFKYVAPVAGAMGYSAEDVSLALGLMANSGIKASSAGTSLRNILTNMANPTDKMSAAMDKLGIELDDGKGNMLSFRELLDSLRSGFGELKMPADEATAAFAELDQQLADGTIDQKEYDRQVADLTERVFGAEGAMKAQTAAMLAGKNGMAGLMAVVNATEGDYDKLTGAIDNCSQTFVKTADGAILPMSEALEQGIDWVEEYNGASEQMAATMNDNLGGQLKILISQLQELAISLGEIMMPIIRDIVTKLQGLVDWLNGLDEGTKRIIITVAAVVAALGPLLIFVGKVMGAVGTIMTWAPKIQGALTLLSGTVIPAVKGALTALWGVLAANPVGMVIAVVAALVAAFIYFWNTSEGFRQFWINLWENIKATAMAVWEALSGFFQTAWETIVNIAATIWNGLKDFFSGLWAGIQEIFSTVLQTIVTIVTTYFTIYRSIITTVLGAIKTVITTVWNAIKEYFTSVLNGIQTIVKTYFNACKTIITTVLSAILTVITTIWNAIKEYFAAVLNGIQAKIQSCFTACKTIITTVLGAIQMVISTVWNAISDFFSKILGRIKTIVQNGFDSVKKIVSDRIKAVHTIISTVWKAILTVFSNAISAINSKVVSGFKTMLKNMVTVMKNILTVFKNGFTTVKNFFTSLARSAYYWGRDIIAGMIKGIKSAIGVLTDSVKNIAKTIRSYLHFSVPDVGPLTDFESWMPDFMKGLAKGIEDNRGLVQKAMGDVSSDMAIEPETGDVTLSLPTIVSSDTAGVSLLALLRSLMRPTEELTEAMELLGIQMDNLSIPREALEAIRTAFGEALVPGEVARETLTDLDKQMEAGTITQQEYSEQLSALAREWFRVNDAARGQAIALLEEQDALTGLVSVITASTDDFNAFAEAMDRASTVDVTLPKLEEPQIPDVSEGVMERVQQGIKLLQSSVTTQSVPIVLNPELETKTSGFGYVSGQSESFEDDSEEIVPVLQSVKNLLTALNKPTEETAENVEKLGEMFSSLRTARDVLETLRSEFGELSVPTDAEESITDLNRKLADGSIAEEEFRAKLSALTEQLFGAENAEKALAAATLMGRDGMASLLAIVTATEGEIGQLSAEADRVSDLRVAVPDVEFPADVETKTETFLGQIVEAIREESGPVQSVLGSMFEGVTFAPDNSAASTTMETLTSRGIGAEREISALRTLLESLNEPTEEAAAALNLLGIRMDDLHTDRETLEALREKLGRLKVPAGDAVAALEGLDSQLTDGAISQNEYRGRLAALRSTIFGVENALKAQSVAALMGRDGLTALIAVASATEEEFGALADAVTRPIEPRDPEPDVPEFPQPEVPEPNLPDYGPQMRAFLSTLLAEIENAREPVQSAMAALSADLVVTPRVGAVEVDTDALSTALGSVNDGALQTEGVLTLLKNLLNSMTTPTEETAAALNKLGIQMENLHTPGEALEAMRAAFGATLAPAEEVRAALSMLDSQLSSGAISQQEYTENLSTLAEKALGVEGALKAQAAAMLAGEKGLAGLMALVTASTEDFNALADAMDRAGSVDISTQEAVPQPPEQQPQQPIQMPSLSVLPEMQDFLSSISKTIQSSRTLLEKSLQNTSVDLILSPKIQDNTQTTDRPSQESAYSSTLVAMLAEYLPYLPQLANMKLVTDTGALVGQLASQMDEQLGILALRQRRQ